MTDRDAKTMTLCECRDFIARYNGYRFGKHHRVSYECWIEPDGHPYVDMDGHMLHPIEATLDAAAAAMPEGWHFSSMIYRKGHPEGPQAEWWCESDDYKGAETVSATADTELLARFRLAVSCRQAQKGPTP